MAIATGQFERVAETIAERTSELLGVPVSVLDAWGTVVAGSDPDTIGLHFDFGAEPEETYLRVPLRLESGAGEVVVFQSASPDPMPPRLTQVLVELTVNQTVVVDRLPNQHELKNKFIHDLLHGSIVDETSTFREAQILGMDLTSPRAVILIDASHYILAPAPSRSNGNSELRIKRRAQMVIGSVVDFFHLPNDTICAYIGDGEVAVLKASNRNDLAAWVDSADEEDQPSWAHLEALKRAGAALLARLRSDTRSTVNLGVGRYHPGLSGLARSYQDARAALSLGRRFLGQNRVHCLDSLGIPAFVGVTDQSTKIDLATYFLSPLDHEPELLSTLDTFFSENCCPSAAAARLSIHRNTLGYRLDKINSLTGLNPRRFDDAVQIRLALALRSLQIDPRNCANA